MIKKTIKENSSLTIDDKYLDTINNMIEKNRSLPMKLIGNVLAFNDYTVGIIKIDNLLIEIESRNDAISFNSIFEMYSFVNSNHIDPSMQSQGFSIENTFELTSLSNYFFKICYSLLSQGLTGVFIKKKSLSKFIKGTILFDEYIPQMIPYEGIMIESEEYTIDSLPNQIIKAALKKIKLSKQNEKQIRELNFLLREFDYVTDKQFDYYELDHFKFNIDTFFSPNLHYPLVLETSIKILQNLTMSYHNGEIESYSFLVNSNDIFEKYIRKIMDRGLKENVTKWESPKIFASVKKDSIEGYKSYSPDILIDYHKNTEVCRAVVDVKNKPFNPNQQNASELVSTNDLYQLLFYCQKLNANVGALIYPTKNNHDPYKIEISYEGDPLIFLLSINMQDTFENRFNKLTNEIKDYILNNT